MIQPHNQHNNNIQPHNQHNNVTLQSHNQHNIMIPYNATLINTICNHTTT